MVINFIKKLLRPTSKGGSATPAVPRLGHRISKLHISQNALKVLQKLQHAGYEAYLVGGSVRDLLLNQQPKDFDIATNATPQEVRRLFRNARVIGRRFKLVHVVFYQEIIEVATFRAANPIDQQNHQTNPQGMIIRDNVYGNLSQDSWRRDFTINALYYDAHEGQLRDITNGMPDLEQRILRLIGDPLTRYQEDPVRMIRAIRFAAKLDFTIEPHTAEPIARLAPLLQHISPSRLFDEVIKSYQCGYAKKVHALFIQHTLFQQLFPQVLHPGSNPLIALALESTDARIQLNKPVTPAFLFAVLLWFPLQAQLKICQKKSDIPFLEALEKAMSIVLTAQSRKTSIPRRFLQIIREIWLLQYRFPKRLGTRAQHLLSHARFRAAYDMLALRALSGDAPAELADWWTRFQEVSPEAQQHMVQALTPP